MVGSNVAAKMGNSVATKMADNVTAEMDGSVAANADSNIASKEDGVVQAVITLPSNFRQHYCTAGRNTGTQYQ